ncbi:MAG: AAA family ATPase [Rhodospirillales bacterium]|nr:AAA family ATPase [Rhodospirillales bacterium]MDE0385954.1 AAA family ATPase [Defluviicoccus sp.]
MITALKLFDFKNFARETLGAGPFTVIVGANATGKSNIRDAFRFLHGIGRGYALSEIVGGKHGAGGQLEWESIRGGPREISRAGSGVFAFSVALTVKSRKFSYFAGVASEAFGESGFKIGLETLVVDNETVYHWRNEELTLNGEKLAKDTQRIFRRDQPILAQLHEMQAGKDVDLLVGTIVEAFASMRFLDLAPDSMRQPSFPGQTVLGDRGENLPSVLKELCAKPEHKDVLMQWTRELTPMDMEDVEFPLDPAGRVHLVLRERGRKETTAFSASDGTLRFLAMLAALLGPDPAQLYFLEEIDNGIHPSRLSLLVDLIERQTAKGGSQVIATTHSPELLTIMGDVTFNNTSVVCRLEGADDAVIRPVAELPNAAKLRKSQGLGRLLTSGWMETAVTFSEDDENGREVSE